jgi:hypothetical protein
VVDPFWGGRKEKLTERTSSTVRCGRPEVVVDSSGCGEVVHDGAVLGAWSNRSERGRSGLSTAAQRQREHRRSGGRKAEEEERVLHGGGGRPL